MVGVLDESGQFVRELCGDVLRFAAGQRLAERLEDEPKTDAESWNASLTVGALLEFETRTAIVATTRKCRGFGYAAVTRPSRPTSGPIVTSAKSRTR